MSFSNHDSFDNADYSNFISKHDSGINVVASVKRVKIENNTSESTDRGKPEKTQTGSKSYKKFQMTKLHVDDDTNKEARNAVQSLI